MNVGEIIYNLEEHDSDLEVRIENYIDCSDKFSIRDSMNEIILFSDGFNSGIKNTVNSLREELKEFSFLRDIVINIGGLTCNSHMVAKEYDDTGKLITVIIGR